MTRRATAADTGHRSTGAHQGIGPGVPPLPSAVRPWCMIKGARGERADQLHVPQGELG
ncbi:protein of unknown function [Streptomyces murinus]